MRLGCWPINYKDAHTYLTESLLLYQEIGDRSGVALSYCNLGLVEYLLDNPHAAYAHLGKSLQILRETDEQGHLIAVQCTLVPVFLCLNRISDAQTALVRVLQLADALAVPSSQVDALLMAGRLAHAQGEDERAATWLGLIETIGVAKGVQTLLLQTLVGELENALGAERFVQALARGKILEIAKGVRQAISKYR